MGTGGKLFHNQTRVVELEINVFWWLIARCGDIIKKNNEYRLVLTITVISVMENLHVTFRFF